MTSTEPVSGRLRVAITYTCPKAVKPYVAALEHVGVDPVLITPEMGLLTNTEKMYSFLDDLDGLLVSGGIDVNCKRYGQEKHPKADPSDDTRDELESLLLSEMISRDMPCLGVCRGMQLLNVVRGGTLIQHIENVHIHQIRPEDLWTIAHDVEVIPDTRLYSIVGDQVRIGVNSRHHQAVDVVGDGLRVCARAVPDGVVEAIEMPEKRFVVGVQWHPENGVARDDSQTRLFAAFAASMSV